MQTNKNDRLSSVRLDGFECHRGAIPTAITAVLLRKRPYKQKSLILIAINNCRLTPPHRKECWRIPLELQACIDILKAYLEEVPRILQIFIEAHHWNPRIVHCA